MRKQHQVTYRYRNEDEHATELWLSIPEQAELLETNLSPSQQTSSCYNELHYFVIQPQSELTMTYQINPSSAKKVSLSSDEKQFYVRSSYLCYWDEETRALAQSIIANQTDPRAQAEAIFVYVVDHFKYVYPPKARGVQSFCELGKGDCGEFSQLYAALCRSIGIPCRVIYGCWALGKMNGHAWNEVYIEGDGWVEVDSSMARLQKYSKWQFLFSSLRTYHWKDYFGAAEGQKINFSYDGDIKLEPPFEQETAAKAIISSFPLCGRDFHWGIDSLNGNAPYLQPAYVRFNENREKPVKAKELLGTWAVQEPLPWNLLFWTKRVAVGLLVCFFLLDLLTVFAVPSLVTGAVLLSVCLAFVLRGERKVLFSVLSCLVLGIMINSAI
ncbi:transglutaminase-like domain-containing protein [Gracilibacillus phocaeensis]|uniref:transglutaminase-like domain-containing protein n=1 Tax=Gracilibacillus phocaeensis TaxID=2042304 RepID=UPI00102FED5A|nr:transglutaminase-like domain-containing protein [Gracilibacillus phocaeensis]